MMALVSGQLARTADGATLRTDCISAGRCFLIVANFRLSGKSCPKVSLYSEIRRSHCWIDISNCKLQGNPATGLG
jgi:hypothetical protein